MQARFAAPLALALGLLIGGCDLGDYGPTRPPTVDTPVFHVPTQFQPDTGWYRNDHRRIQGKIFSVVIPAEWLAAQVPGYEEAIFTMRQDVSVIVRPHIPSLHDGSEVSARTLQFRQDIWTMSGSFELACMGPNKDPVTGYYRYYKYCDPEPSINGGLWLMDRIPDAALPRPDFGYIKASCRDHAALIRQGAFRDHIPDEVVEHLSCTLIRYTAARDHIQFRLKGNNVAYERDVFAVIETLLNTWRQPAEDVSGD